MLVTGVFVWHRFVLRAIRNNEHGEGKRRKEPSTCLPKILELYGRKVKLILNIPKREKNCTNE